MFSSLRHAILTALFAIALCSTSCGTEDAADGANDTSELIVISDTSFIPDSLTVIPGETVIFYNTDAMTYRILSESAENAFDHDGVFESNIIIAQSYGSITIPEDAVPGTTIFFYNEYLESAMATPNGRFEVE